VASSGEPEDDAKRASGSTGDVAQAAAADAPAPAQKPVAPAAPQAEKPAVAAGSARPYAPPRGGPPKTLTQKLMRVVDEAFHTTARRPDGSINKRVFYPLYALRVLLQVVRQWARDRCPQQAASLAFQSALSIVPLIAIALVLLRAFGAIEAQSALVDIISKQVLPISREEISKHLVGWADNMSDYGTVGVTGFFTMMVLSFIMFNSTESIFNDIWRSEKRRSLGQKLVVFYALVTIIPALMGISLYHAARYGLTSGFVGAFGALSATWVALVLANKLLPTAFVGWGPAAIGALFSALTFEASKHLFGLYLAHVAFQSYAGIYGTLGLLPALLVWIYYSWLVVLLGAEIAHAAQNLRQLERLDRRSRSGSPENELLEKVNGLVAARFMCAVVEAWRKGQPPLGRDALAARFDVSEEVADRIVRRLRERHLLLEVDGAGYLPARHPGEIHLADVLSAFRTSDVVSASEATGGR
jgi:membrane protein